MRLRRIVRCRLLAGGRAEGVSGGLRPRACGCSTAESRYGAYPWLPVVGTAGHWGSDAWPPRYQPVSASLHSRSGTPEELRAAVAGCRQAGAVVL